MAGRGGGGGVGGGVAQLGLSRGQAPAHITGACSRRLWFAGGCRVLYWIGTAAQGEGVSSAGGRGGAEKEGEGVGRGEESRVAGDRDLSSRALRKDEEMHARPLAAEPEGVFGASVRQ